MTNDNSKNMLRVSVHEQDIHALMDKYPMLSRTEISDIVTRHGPMRAAVEAELERISRFKR